MGEMKRKPFQGVTNIIKFNWHFYVMATLGAGALVALAQVIPENFRVFPYSIVMLVVLGTTLSLAVSFYIYDCSGLYTLHWLAPLHADPTGKLVNIHAGFDETSFLLSEKYPYAELLVLDFYDPAKHTEVSIARARKAYPPYPNTRSIRTSRLTLQGDTADLILIILAAHEIRDREERIGFFKELQSSLRDGGKIVVVEHLRDIANFIAYNVGFLHFLSGKEWNATFRGAGLTRADQYKITPFLSVFILQKDGITA